MGFIAIHTQFGVTGKDDFDGGTKQPLTDPFQVTKAELVGEQFEQCGEANQSG